MVITCPRPIEMLPNTSYVIYSLCYKGGWEIRIWRKLIKYIISKLPNIIGLNNGVSSIRQQAIIQPNAHLPLIYMKA